MKSCPHCGCALESGRSAPHLRRYFAMIRAVYDHWPETHRQQFDSVEHCRKWLQMKAGHRDVHTAITLDAMSERDAILTARATLAAAGTYAEVVAHRGQLLVLVPRSIAFDKLDHKAACALFNEVDEVIEAETGVSGSQYLQQTEVAA